VIFSLVFKSTNFVSSPITIYSTEAAEEEEDTIKEAMVEEEAIMTDRAVEADTAEEEEIVTKAEDTKLFEGKLVGDFGEVCS